MIQVDKQIPIPPKQRPKYPWATMEIGDSFFVDGPGATMFQSGASSNAKRYGIKVATRRVAGGVRVWRIA